MKITASVKKEEALRRMKALNMFKDAIRLYETKGVVMMSESLLGTLFFLDESIKKEVEYFEKSENALVYAVIHTPSSFGDLYSLLYVSDYEENWDYDNLYIKDGTPYAYVVNTDDPMLSETGIIGVVSRNGGLVRVS